MKSEDFARLILRLAVGGMMLLHGIAKVRHGVGGIVSSVGSHGLPHALGYGVYVGEVLAPLLVLVGIFTRPAAAIVAIDMIFALYLMHGKDLGHLSGTGGWAVELPMLYLAGAVAIALLGAGRYAVNAGVSRFN